MSQLTLRTEHLEIGHVRSRKERRVVRADINVSARPGEFVCLLGPNGAGKSTLIKTLAGALPPLSGKVFVNGAELGSIPPLELAKRLSVTLTSRVAPGAMTVYALAALGRFPHTNWIGKLGPEDHRIVQEALELAGAAELAARDVNELSDGERQKAMIARALAQAPDVMILDEPTSFLDMPRKVELTRLLLRLARDTNKTVVCSTHDLDLALRAADTIWLLPAEGPLLTGAPETLAFDGSIGRAFNTPEVDFDQSCGEFQIHKSPCGGVRLMASGAARFWAGRLLERAGLSVSESGPSLEVDDALRHWTLDARQGEGIDSLFAALSVLRP